MQFTHLYEIYAKHMQFSKVSNSKKTMKINYTTIKLIYEFSEMNNRITHNIHNLHSDIYEMSATWADYRPRRSWLL